VLLGDLIELRHGPLRGAMEIAEAVLREIGAALGAGREVVIVPGNHDHHLLSAWFERRASLGSAEPLGLCGEVDWHEGDPLASLARWLGPADVRVLYPGVWLREDVYATHGHYADRHTTVPMLERLGAGAMARVVGEPPDGPRAAEDYEAVLAPMYAWLHALAQHGGPSLGASSHGAWRVLAGRDGRRGSLRRRAAVAGFPAAIVLVNRLGLGPVRADISGAALRAASLRAFGEVCSRLGVQARYAIFGHTHRTGPLPGDDASQWRSANGPRLLNAGSWVFERQYLGDAADRGPYWPGGCVLVQDSGPPELRLLLSDRSHEELAPSP
jgi:hypothetical protein